MDLVAVRTFLQVTSKGQFQSAADELGVTQQAVSKRIGALERELGVVLFARGPRGATLTVDGQAFLPHARELLQAEDRAIASVAPGRRALRVDVRNRRTAPATVLHAFYQQRRALDLNVVALADLNLEAALAAVASGTVDATFRGLTDPKRQLSGTGLSSALVIEDRHELLVGPEHPLSGAPSVTPRQLADHPIWMPGLPSGDEVSAYYDELAATFGITIDVLGPAFGAEVLVTEIAESATLANLVGEGSRYLWPAHYDLRRIPIVDPTPVFPLWVIWRTDNRQPDLAELLAFLKADFAGRQVSDSWRPSWARHGH
ncbi:LysR family transcriptional regulator [Pseudofrankia inefficax]|uniref:Transcriptional regulator, LysR family n=1 Tax=Pseudofrankia inefficax (strain DSM 45817 / CECT 9037 / DDB 130130 / EuI1c) TaxID=298654 RepID=E3IU05_PSEI1|nr:LysR family transcriptional regulator [Pseudofrankia inefficax]ADP81198.1 transcriptional regulator, LysR family [Pseudofrankia inefficax]